MLVSRVTPWQSALRAQPYNDSYDAMFIAAMSGIGLTAAWAWRDRSRSKTGDPAPRYQSGRTAFEFFEILLAALLGVLNWLAGAVASGLIWSFAALTLCGAMLATKLPAGLASPMHSRLTRWLATGLLILFAVLFLLGPVGQPEWSGPPERFVRWHPYSLPGELAWHDIFFSLAAGMLIVATDPLGRHRLFLVMLSVSGTLHATEMAADNLLSAHMSGTKGNMEHLYGDILGWYVIAACAAALLSLSRPRGSLARIHS